MRFKCNVSKQAIVLTRTEGLVFGGGSLRRDPTSRKLEGTHVPGTWGVFEIIGI